MSIARRQRREYARKSINDHVSFLATLLADFYDFLSQKDQPSDQEVRDRFQQSDKKWREYCHNKQLTNIDHLFTLNVREAWHRHTQSPKDKQ